MSSNIVFDKMMGIVDELDDAKFYEQQGREKPDSADVEKMLRLAAGRQVRLTTSQWQAVLKLGKRGMEVAFDRIANGNYGENPGDALDGAVDGVVKLFAPESYTATLQGV